MGSQHTSLNETRLFLYGFYFPVREKRQSENKEVKYVLCQMQIIGAETVRKVKKEGCMSE